jgi:hypothetical protein
MRGEEDRECRAKGGVVQFNAKGSKALKAFHGSHSPNTPDASLKRGGGPLFRKRGGRLPEAFKEHEGDPEEDREEKAAGGAISGAGAKPSMGRAGRPGRKHGGIAGAAGGSTADLHPITHPHSPATPKGRKLMAESEKTP